MPKAKLLFTNEVKALDGAGGRDTVISETEPLPDEVAIQIARGFEILGPKYNDTRSTLADFDACLYRSHFKAVKPDPEDPGYLAFRSIRTGKGIAGIAVKPLGPVRHLETAQTLVELDRLEKSEKKETQVVNPRSDNPPSSGRVIG